MKKMGCASCGGAMKKMQKGGSAEIVGMPKYGNNPRTSTGAMLKKGGSVKKYQDGGPVAAMQKAMGQKPVSTKKTMKYVRKKGSGYIPSAESNKPDTSKWVEKQASPNAKRMQKGGVTKKLVKAQDGIRVKQSDLKKEYTSAPRAGAQPISDYLFEQRENRKGPRLDAYKPKSVVNKNFYNDPRFSKGVELNDNFYKKEKDAGTLFKKGLPTRMSESRPKVEKDNPKLNQIVEGKKGGVAKAKFGATVDVQRGYPGKIRSAEAQGYTAVGKREPARTKFAKGGSAKSFPDLNKDGKITKADILKGRGVIKRKGGAIKKK
jgi:hypothetical protein